MAAVFVAPAEDVEQQFASSLREGHVAELVDDQQADPGELVLEAEQPFLVSVPRSARGPDGRRW